jgi:hypothetical protein
MNDYDVIPHKDKIYRRSRLQDVDKTHRREW